MSVKRPYEHLKDEVLDIKKPMTYAMAPSTQVSLPNLSPQGPHALNPTFSLSPSGPNGPVAPQLPHNGLSVEEAQCKEAAENFTAYMPECKNCRSNTNVIEDYHNGCLICTTCGMQLGGQMIASGAEWRTFADDGTKKNMDPSRVGGIDDDLLGVGTTIGGAGHLASRHAQTSMTPEYRTFLNVHEICRRIGGHLRLSDHIMQLANQLCKLVVYAPQSLRGKTLKLDSLAAVCVYQACRDAGVDRKKDEIIAVSEVTEKAFNKQYKRVTTVRHSLGSKATQAAPTQVRLDAINYVQRYIAQLNLPERLADVAMCVVRSAKDRDIITSSQPASLAGASVYFVALLDGTPVDLASVGKHSVTSSDTLLKIARELHANRVKVVPDNFVDPVVLERMPRP